LNEGKIPTIESAWNYVQAEELQRTFLEVVRRHTDLIQSELVNFPINEAELTERLKQFKQACVADFKQNLMGGAELLNSVKGVEYQLKVKDEMRKIAY
jgi:hypothetical protein